MVSLGAAEGGAATTEEQEARDAGVKSSAAALEESEGSGCRVPPRVRVWEESLSGGSKVLRVVEGILEPLWAPRWTVDEAAEPEVDRIALAIPFDPRSVLSAGRRAAAAGVEEQGGDEYEDDAALLERASRPQTRPFAVSVSADRIHPSVRPSRAVFRPTPMYQTRTEELLGTSGGRLALPVRYRFVPSGVSRQRVRTAVDAMRRSGASGSSGAVTRQLAELGRSPFAVRPPTGMLLPE